MEDIFISALSARKVAHHHDLSFVLSAETRKNLILTGKNGSGKTSLLKEIDIVLKEDFGIFHTTGNNKVYHQKNYNSSNNVQFEFSIEGDFSIEQFIYSFFEARRKPYFERARGVYSIDKLYYEKAYPSDSGLTYDYNMFTPANEVPPQELFLQYIVNLKAERAFASNDKKDEEVKTIDSWFLQFENLLRQIFEDNNLELIFDSKTFNFLIQRNEHEKFDFLTLSDGYASILSIVSELLIKAGLLRLSITDLQGMVLIDEIETHLHIDLQKKIMPFLTTVFPKIQFIVTTHSPFVLNSIDNAVIYDLENKIQVEDLSGYSVDGIIESYFNSDKYSQKLKDKIAEYEGLIDKMEKLSDDERDRMVELSIYFKNIPKFYAPELEVKIQQLELLKLVKK